MGFIQFEKIRINRGTYIEWLYNREFDQFKVVVRRYNREIYVKKLDEKHYKIYRSYINERIKYLIGENIIDREYSMILLDNTMYKVLDNFHFMELIRFLVPVDGLEEFEFKNNLFDIVLDATMRTGEIFDETDLVFHNGIFYIDGKNICSVKEFDRVGIEYEQYDLMNGLNEEQGEYIFHKMYIELDYIKVKNYITKDTKIKLG